MSDQVLVMNKGRIEITDADELYIILKRIYKMLIEAAKGTTLELTAPKQL
jgi:hypothetical protein